MNTPTVAVSPGTGRLARRQDALLFDATGENEKLVAIFEGAASDTLAIAEVKKLVVSEGFELGAFAIVRWGSGLDLLVFGDVELYSSAPSAPMIGGSSSNTWVEHHVDADVEQPVTVSCGDEIDGSTDLRLGVVPSSGFLLTFTGEHAADIADSAASNPVESSAVVSDTSGIAVSDSFPQPVPAEALDPVTQVEPVAPAPSSAEVSTEVSDSFPQEEPLPVSDSFPQEEAEVAPLADEAFAPPPAPADFIAPAPAPVESPPPPPVFMPDADASSQPPPPSASSIAAAAAPAGAGFVLDESDTSDDLPSALAAPPPPVGHPDQMGFDDLFAEPIHEGAELEDPPTIPEPDHLELDPFDDSHTSPDPLAGDPFDAGAAGAAAPAVGLVESAMCERGHANPPRSSSCFTCGAAIGTDPDWSLIEQPIVGHLLFTDGATIPVDRRIVIGRKPPAADTLTKNVTLDHPEVSRTHAELSVEGWAVLLTDNASRNGTYVCLPGETAPVRLDSGVKHYLETGTTVHLGSAEISFTYEVDAEAP